MTQPARVMEVGVRLLALIDGVSSVARAGSVIILRDIMKQRVSGFEESASPKMPDAAR